MNLESNISKIYMIRFFKMFNVLMPIFVPFFLSKDIEMQGVYLLQSVFAITTFIFEIPSGYVADTLGRKKSMVAGTLLTALGYTMFPIAEDLTLLVIGELLLGIALSLTSGTDTAIMYDTLAATDSQASQKKVLGMASYYFSIGEATSAILSSILIYLSLTIHHLAIIMAAAAFIPFFISLTIHEPPRRVMDGKHRDNFKYIITQMFKQSKLFNLIILNAITCFSGTLFAIWLFQKYWKELHIPLAHFGILWAIINFAVAYISKRAHKIEQYLGTFTVLSAVGLLPVVSYIGIGAVEHVIGVAICLLFQISRGLGQVILRDAVNQRVTADFRATANSIISMGVRVFFTIVGPVLGMIMDHKGISYASYCIGTLYLIVFIFIMIPLLKEKSFLIPAEKTNHK